MKHLRNNKKPFFICFTGVDGSGKTTQAKMLAETMKEKGIKNKYVYNRFVPFLIRPAMAIGRASFLRGRDMFDNYGEYCDRKRKLFKNQFLSMIYQRLSLFDYFFQVLLKVKVPLLLGKSIVCDRYIYDTVITDLAVDLGYSEEQIGEMIERYSWVVPEPDLVILIDLAEEVAYERKGDIPSIDYLRERRQLYLNVVTQSINKGKLLVVDGSEDVREIEELIWGKVAEILRDSKNVSGVSR